MNEIGKLRQALNLDQNRFSNLLGVHETLISKWENGTRTPRFKTIQALRKLAEKNDIEFDLDNIPIYGTKTASNDKEVTNDSENT